MEKPAPSPHFLKELKIPELVDSLSARLDAAAKRLPASPFLGNEGPGTNIKGKAIGTIILEEEPLSGNTTPPINRPHQSLQQNDFLICKNDLLLLITTHESKHSNCFEKRVYFAIYSGLIIILALILCFGVALSLVNSWPVIGGLVGLIPLAPLTYLFKRLEYLESQRKSVSGMFLTLKMEVMSCGNMSELKSAIGKVKLITKS